jgi:hypothetical protein
MTTTTNTIFIRTAWVNRVIYGSGFAESVNGMISERFDTEEQANRPLDGEYRFEKLEKETAVITRETLKPSVDFL